MYHIAICDDNKADRLILQELLLKDSRRAEQIMIHEYCSGESLLIAMDELRFSMVFLDMQMDGMDGEETAKHIRATDDKLVLVFVTGSAMPAPNIFEVQPYRYLIKTAPKGNLETGILNAFEKMLVNEDMPLVKAVVGKRTILIYPNDIIYIEKYKRKCRIHLTRNAKNEYNINDNDEVLFDGKLKDLFESLEMHNFGWPHDCYVVNFKYGNCFTSDTISLAEANCSIPITRRKAREFNIQKNRFLMEKYK